MASPHELPLDTPILYLQCNEAFKGLSEKERRYAHHLSKASWWSSLIIFCQTSPEAPGVFSMLTRLFRSEPLDSLKTHALEKKILTEDEFKSLLIYYCGLVYNCGNYLGMGDRKFVPTISREQLLALIKTSKTYLENPDCIMQYYNRVVGNMYDLTDEKKFLGMPPNGTTMYFTPNCTQKDADLCKEYMTARNIEGWNTRLIKHEDGSKVVYDIRIASVEKDAADGITVKEDTFEGQTFTITRGDYSPILKMVNAELALAKNYAANDMEINMLERYIESFKTGSVKAHKEGSTFWVKNKSPAVELYLGFIEVYRDPTNQRAEFESFVAIVNREQSRKFDIMVEKAEKEILPLLPWGKDFEEDEFMRPDFSSLDIMTFATSGLPIGINIPNYKDIKEEQGFKNVCLTNVLSSRTGDKSAQFLTQEDAALREKFGSTSLEICVGLHELLGHGSGKFLRRKDDGTLNFDPEKVKNPFTGNAAGFYETGESYQTKFTNLSSAYEECRAETVALYLCLIDDVLDIFNIPDEDKENIKYIMWLDMFYAGIKGLELYQLKNNLWGQAHCQARYVILQVGLEAGDGLVNVQEIVGKDGLPDLVLSVDKSKIATVGKKAMGEFLRKLQVYRAMGDSEAGREMFEKYSRVSDEGSHPFSKWHEIVTRKRRPRMILTMPNTNVGSDDKVELISYPDGVEGKVLSWVNRFSAKEYEVVEETLTQYMGKRNQARE
uniref:Dipeptidyl peptidase 3 n=2 Tax=Hirondellea gigas TaxID=1518452 RepID=A0A2P2HZ51_9CRUS